MIKTVRFSAPTYLGDPINIARIFNDKEVDEIALLDVLATRESREPNFDLVADLASECFMPLCYGGGVRTIDQMRRLFKIGVEKVALNSSAVDHPQLVREAAEAFGASSVVVSIDVKRRLWRGREVVTRGGTRRTGLDPVAHARAVEAAGAGEILLTSVDRDGTMQGYDIELVRSVSSAVAIPVIASGGAASLDDFRAALHEGGAAAVAAGSMFVFSGPHRAVLISYPSPKDIAALAVR